MRFQRLLIEEGEEKITVVLQDSIYGVDASADGEIILSASGDGSVRLWNSVTAECLVTIIGMRVHRCKCWISKPSSSVIFFDK